MPNYRYNTPDYMRRNMCGPSSVKEKQSPVNCRPVTRTEYDSLAGMSIAMAYVRWQDWCAIYDVEKGFHYGTIFEELNKPFKGIGGCC